MELKQRIGRKRKIEDGRHSESIESCSDQIITRKKKIHSFVEYPGGDWIISTEMTITLIFDVLKVAYPDTSKWKSLTVFIPGVGLSSVPVELYKRGIIHIVLLDIENVAIEKQNNDFISLYGSIPDTVSVYKSDVLESGFDVVSDMKFDIIIDKGFMDVFLRQGNSMKVWKSLLKLHKEEGIFLFFSIFHAKWKKYLTKKQFKSTAYSVIDVKRYSSSRPTVSTFSYPGAFFVAGFDLDLLQTIKFSSADAKPFQNFTLVKAIELPSDASSF